MRRLFKLCLVRICQNTFDTFNISGRTVDRRKCQARSFLQTQLLWILYRNGIYFLRDHGKQVSHTQAPDDLPLDSPHPHSLLSITAWLDFPWCHSPLAKRSDHGRKHVICFISQVSSGPARECSTLFSPWTRRVVGWKTQLTGFIPALSQCFPAHHGQPLW